MENGKTKKYGHISMAETSITVMIKISVCVSELGLNMCTGRSRGLASGKLAERSKCHAIGKIYARIGIKHVYWVEGGPAGFPLAIMIQMEYMHQNWN